MTDSLAPGARSRRHKAVPPAGPRWRNGADLSAQVFGSAEGYRKRRSLAHRSPFCGDGGRSIRISARLRGWRLAGSGGHRQGPPYDPFVWWMFVTFGIAAMSAIEF